MRQKVSISEPTWTQELYPYTPLYYTAPTQVRYWNVVRGRYVGGIAYHDFVIDGVSGEVMLIEGIISAAQAVDKIDFENALIELAWIDISQEIWEDSMGIL